MDISSRDGASPQDQSAGRIENSAIQPALPEPEANGEPKNTGFPRIYATDEGLVFPDGFRFCRVPFGPSASDLRADLARLFPGLPFLPSDKDVTMIRKMIRRLEPGDTSLHEAPTGAHKTSNAVIATAYMALTEGYRFVFAEPSVDLATEVAELYEQLMPPGTVVRVFGSALSEEDREDEGKYPFDKNTMIIVCCHEQFMRRGFSTKLRGFGLAIRPKKNDVNPWHLVFDEAHLLVQGLRSDFSPSHRKREGKEVDRAITLCPKSSASGVCLGCKLYLHGGSRRTNAMGHPEVRPPIHVHKHARAGHPCGEEPDPFDDLDVTYEHERDEDGYRAGKFGRASRVIAFNGAKPDWRSMTPKFYVRGEEEEEDVNEVFGSYILWSRNPVRFTNFAVTKEGRIIKPEEMRAMIETGDDKWDVDISFPLTTCETRTILGDDMMPLAALRDYQDNNHISLSFLGATLAVEDREPLEDALGPIEVVEHPAPETRMHSLAVVMPKGLHGLNALLRGTGKGEKPHLATLRLEKHGNVFVFTDKQRSADILHRKVFHTHGSACVINGQKKSSRFKNSEEPKTFLVSGRSALSVGQNLEDLKCLIIDVRTYIHLSSFIPGKLAPEEFNRMRAEERVNNLIQAIGRATRGKEGHNCAIVLLNCDDHFRAAVRGMRWLKECSEATFFPEVGDDLDVILDQVDRYLADHGNQWPEPRAEAARPKKKEGRRKLTFEELCGLATEAREKEEKYSQFRRKYSLNEKLSEDELNQIRKIFENEDV
jgi:hypothetical protein